MQPRKPRNPLTGEPPSAERTKVAVNPYNNAVQAKTLPGEAVNPGEPLRYGNVPVTATKTGKIVRAAGPGHNP